MYNKENTIFEVKLHAKKTTIKDLSLATGFSITTISQILNGKGDRFSPDTKKKVWDAKKRLNYTPNFNARNLIIQNSGSIAILVPDIGNPFFSTLIKGVQIEAKKQGLFPLIFNSSQKEELERYYLDKVVERNISGIIIASSLITTNLIDTILEQHNIPYLVLDQNSAVSGDRIFIDDLQGGKIVADHLLKLGHQHFIVVLPEKAPTNISARLTGFSNEVKKYSPGNTSITIIHTPLTKNGGYLAAKKILQLKKKATAIFAINDEIAIGLYRGFLERNISIPDTFSIIGYDDIEMDEYIFPKLTSVRQPAQRIGKEATKLLINRINNPKRATQFMKLPVELIVRESTKSNIN